MTKIGDTKKFYINVKLDQSLMGLVSDIKSLFEVVETHSTSIPYMLSFIEKSVDYMINNGIDFVGKISNSPSTFYFKTDYNLYITFSEKSDLIGKLMGLLTPIPGAAFVDGKEIRRGLNRFFYVDQHTDIGVDIPIFRNVFNKIKQPQAEMDRKLFFTWGRVYTNKCNELNEKIINSVTENLKKHISNLDYMGTVEEFWESKKGQLSKKLFERFGDSLEITADPEIIRAAAYKPEEIIKLLKFFGTKDNGYLIEQISQSEIDAFNNLVRITRVNKT